MNDKMFKHMNKNEATICWLVLASLYLWNCGGPTTPVKQEIKEVKQPNIVYILADDLGYGDLQCYNPASKIPTPTLNQLATEGMQFLDAHSPSSVCTPTRYAIMTGRYCWRSQLPKGVLRGYGRSLIEADRLTVASLLKNNGYQTGVVGKWHLGLDWAIKPGHEEALVGGDSQINENGVVTEMNHEHIDFSKKITNGPWIVGLIIPLFCRHPWIWIRIATSKMIVCWQPPRPIRKVMI